MILKVIMYVKSRNEKMKSNIAYRIKKVIQQ